MSEEQSNRKTERILLDLNKNGLSYLTTSNNTQALQYFRKAEKAVGQQLRINPSSSKMNQLAGITYNNLACYYKKNGKPKVALAYLKKALQLEVYKVEDWTSTASTHLNICAIYSYLQKHQQASDHAQLALTMLERVEGKQDKQKQQKQQGQRSFLNIQMLSHYNLAIELQHLKRFQQSKKHYLLAKETIDNSNKKNQNLINSIEESLQRISQGDAQQKKRLIQLLSKRREQQEKGNHQFMRRNKKNFGDQAEWRSIVQTKKYELYKTQNDTKRHYQSTEKVRRLVPIGEGSRSKRGLEDK